MLYFSYGSNMSVKRLQSRVPSARFVSTAFLCSHDLRFHKESDDGSGKCDVYKTGCPEDCVWGVVFEIDAAGKGVLDEKESLGYGYDEKEVTLMTPEGETITAFTYYVIRITQQLKPYRWYLHHVLSGAEENGLSRKYVNRIRRVESIEDPNDERSKREMVIYYESSLQGAS